MEYSAQMTAGRRQRLRRQVAAVTDWLEHAIASPQARIAILSLFVIQAVILVFVTHIGTPPDETNHINFIEYYAHHSLSPIFSHQAPTHSLGDKTREVDYLYHYAMSLLYRIAPLTTVGKYYLIRLCSVAFACLSFGLLLRITKKIGISDAAANLGLLVVSNLPMVLMMSTAVNNDVLVWLGMLLGIWLVLCLWAKPQLETVLWLFVLSFAGGLVKRTLLPLGLVFVVIGLVHIIRQRHVLLAQLRNSWLVPAIIAILLAGSIGLFAERVGGNLVRYHTATPSCEQVDSAAACSVFWVNVRASTLAQTPHDVLMPIPNFVGAWVLASLYNVIDIQTQFWQHTVQPTRWLAFIVSATFIGGMLYGIYYELRAGRMHPSSAARWRLFALAAGLYFMGVHLLVNYSSYLDLKSFGLALNGRYILPSLLPLTILACFYWARLLARHRVWRAALAVVLVVSLLTGSGLVMMLRNTQLHDGNDGLDEPPGVSAYK